MPTEPPCKLRKDCRQSSGGDSDTHSHAKACGEQQLSDVEDTLQNSFISMEETPKGDTHENFGEMPEGEHPPQFTCKKDFTGFSLEDLYIIEICAGSARLSKIAHGHGFKTMAVDHSTARTCGFPICVFDLTDPSDLESLIQFIDEAASRLHSHDVGGASMWHQQ